MNFNCAVFYCMNCKRDIVVDSDQTLTWCCKRSISALPYYLDACGELEKTAKWLREEKQTEILFCQTRSAEEYGCTREEAETLISSMKRRTKTLERVLGYKPDIPYSFPRQDIVKICLEYSPTYEKTVLYEEPYGPPLYRCPPCDQAHSLSQAVSVLLDRPVFAASAQRISRVPKFFELLRLIGAVQMLNRLWCALYTQGVYTVLPSAYEACLPANRPPERHSEL